jgi:hypothetical protein
MAARRHRLADRTRISAPGAVVAGRRRNPLRHRRRQTPLRRTGAESLQSGDDRLRRMHRLVPGLMSQWPALGLKLSLAEQFQIIAGLAPRIDAMSGATPLDALKTGLKLGEGATSMCRRLLSSQEIFGNFAGRGWEWVSAGYLSAASGCGSERSSPGMRRSPSSPACRCWLPPLGVEPAAVRRSAVPSVLRRRDARRLLHRHRSGLRMYDDQGQADLRFFGRRDRLHHSRLRRLPGRRRVSPCCC